MSLFLEEFSKHLLDDLKALEGWYVSSKYKQSDGDESYFKHSVFTCKELCEFYVNSPTTAIDASDIKFFEIFISGRVKPVFEEALDYLKRDKSIHIAVRESLIYILKILNGLGYVSGENYSEFQTLLATGEYCVGSACCYTALIECLSSIDKGAGVK